jgi:hypothetical protein
MNTQNSIFNSNFSTSNPFNMSGNNQTTQDLENSLMQSYARLEALKAKQNQFQQTAQVQQFQQRNVFSDIAGEFEGLSADEATFIVNSKEYQNLNSK